MSDHLDRDTVERMLRGEDTGPPDVAGLLAAMAAAPVRNDRRGEEIAVAAFREARPGVPAPCPRRLLLSRVLTVKAALAGILLVLAGGVAVAASPHLAEPAGDRHPSATHTPTPATSESAAKQLTAPSHTPSSPSATHDHGHRRGHHHDHGHAHHPTAKPSPYESQNSGPPSREKPEDKLGQPVPDLPLQMSRSLTCDALCGLDG
jgi:hypothetical protein